MRRFTGGYRWYILLVLTWVYAFNIADRYVISTLNEPIKSSLHLSDSSVGFLTGTALAIVYTGIGFPLAWLADRSNRRNLLAASIALWSMMTAACGTAGSFLSLLLARVGVGLGEAGATPGSQSIIGDLFGVRERLFANAIFAAGAAVGSLLGGVVGGTISFRSVMPMVGGRPSLASRFPASCSRQSYYSQCRNRRGAMPIRLLPNPVEQLCEK